MSIRRVVITGIGFISPLGLTVEQNWDALMKGKGGIDLITSFPCHSYPTKIAGEVKDFNPNTYQIKTKSLKVMNKTIQYAIASAYQAMLDAKIAATSFPASEIGIALGVDGIQYTVEELLLASYETAGEDLARYASSDENSPPIPIKTKDPDASINPLWPLTVLPNMSLCHIAIQLQLQGPNLVFSSIDAAGSQAIGEAFKSIRQGEHDIYLAGGSYALNTTHFISLSSLNLLSQNNTRPREACKPFDRRRDGCVLGEGGVMLVLEEYSHARERGIPLYAEITGYGSLFNGAAGLFDVGVTPSDYKGMQACMTKALNDAGVSTDDIDYINADGKATSLGDQVEAEAIKNTFGSKGSKIPVSAHKSSMGHLLPAAGAAEAAITALSLNKGCIPPTINYVEKDPEFDLNIIPNNVLVKDIQCAISNTFGFTGEHTTLVLKKCN
jgi:3-oxoacyl-[acyl-carrier-protein] synthase II